jgi:hypothetical protein
MYGHKVTEACKFMFQRFTGKLREFVPYKYGSRRLAMARRVLNVSWYLSLQARELKNAVGYPVLLCLGARIFG